MSLICLASDESAGSEAPGKKHSKCSLWNSRRLMPKVTNQQYTRPQSISIFLTVVSITIFREAIVIDFWESHFDYGRFTFQFA